MPDSLTTALALWAMLSTGWAFLMTVVVLRHDRMHRRMLAKLEAQNTRDAMGVR